MTRSTLPTKQCKLGEPGYVGLTPCHPDMASQRDTSFSYNSRVPPISLQTHVPHTQQTHSVTGQGSFGLRQPAGFHREEVAPHGEKLNSPQPHELNTECMQGNGMATCPSASQLNHAT